MEDTFLLQLVPLLLEYVHCLCHVEFLNKVPNEVINNDIALNNFRFQLRLLVAHRLSHKFLVSLGFECLEISTLEPETGPRTKIGTRAGAKVGARAGSGAGAEPGSEPWLEVGPEPGPELGPGLVGRSAGKFQNFQIHKSVSPQNVNIFQKKKKQLHIKT